MAQSAEDLMRLLERHLELKRQLRCAFIEMNSLVPAPEAAIHDRNFRLAHQLTHHERPYRDLGNYSPSKTRARGTLNQQSFPMHDSLHLHNFEQPSLISDISFEHRSLPRQGDLVPPKRMPPGPEIRLATNMSSNDTTNGLMGEHSELKVLEAEQHEDIEMQSLNKSSSEAVEESIVASAEMGIPKPFVRDLPVANIVIPVATNSDEVGKTNTLSTVETRKDPQVMHLKTNKFGVSDATWESTRRLISEVEKIVSSVKSTTEESCANESSSASNTNKYIGADENSDFVASSSTSAIGSNSANTDVEVIQSSGMSCKHEELSSDLDETTEIHVDVCIEPASVTDNVDIVARPVVGGITSNDDEDAFQSETDRERCSSHKFPENFEERPSSRIAITDDDEDAISLGHLSISAASCEECSDEEGEHANTKVIMEENPETFIVEHEVEDAREAQEVIDEIMEPGKAESDSEIRSTGGTMVSMIEPIITTTEETVVVEAIESYQQDSEIDASNQGPQSTDHLIVVADETREIISAGTSASEPIEGTLENVDEDTLQIESMKFTELNSQPSAPEAIMSEILPQMCIADSSNMTEIAMDKEGDDTQIKYISSPGNTSVEKVQVVHNEIADPETKSKEDQIEASQADSPIEVSREQARIASKQDDVVDAVKTTIDYVTSTTGKSSSSGDAVRFDEMKTNNIDIFQVERAGNENCGSNESKQEEEQRDQGTSKPTNVVIKDKDWKRKYRESLLLTAFVPVRVQPPVAPVAADPSEDTDLATALQNRLQAMRSKKSTAT